MYRAPEIENTRNEVRSIQPVSESNLSDRQQSAASDPIVSAEIRDTSTYVLGTPYIGYGHRGVDQIIRGIPFVPFLSTSRLSDNILSEWQHERLAVIDDWNKQMISLDQASVAYLLFGQSNRFLLNALQDLIADREIRFVEGRKSL